MNSIICRHLHPRLRELQLGRQLLPGEHVRVLRRLERALQLVQLQRRERRAAAADLAGGGDRDVVAPIAGVAGAAAVVK